MHGKWTILFWMMASCPVAASSALDRYLVRPAELPADCKAVPGFFPAGPKVDAFYHYSAYQSVLPKLADRHAQSFDCNGQTGTIYFFQYHDAAEKESAALFARPVLAKESSAWVDWKNGFALFSYKEPPTALLAVVQAKAKGSNSPAPLANVPASPPAAPSELPKRIDIASEKQPVLARVTVSTAAVKAPALAPPPAPVRTVTVAAVSAPPNTPLPPVNFPDVADSVLASFSGNLNCANAQTSSEMKSICQWLDLFRQGKRPEAWMAAGAIAIGRAFRIDGYGRLEEMYFDILVGNGRQGELSLFSIKPADGTEDFEGQVLIDARQHQKPLPENALLARIAAHPRPHQVTVGATAGASIALLGNETKRVFLRKKDNQWILLAVSGVTPDEQARNSFVIATLY